MNPHSPSTPEAAPRPRRRGHVTPWTLFALLLVSYAWFHTGGGPAQNSRYALTRAIVRSGRMEIDDYRTECLLDRAERGARHYSDKAPGLSFAAAPAYAVAMGVPLGKPSPGVLPEHGARLHVTTFLSVGVVAAAGGLALYELLRLMGLSRRVAAGAALACGLGTPYFAYATTFMDHTFTAALLVASLYLCRLGREPGQPAALYLAAGAAAALGVIAEYPAAVVGTTLFVYTVRTTRSWRNAVFFAVGAAPFLVLPLAYNSICFGGPWSTGYAFHANAHFREQMARGFLGVTYPRPMVVLELIFGPYRGALLLSPFLVLAVPGFVRLWRQRDARAEWVFCLVASVFYMLFTSSYYMWDGGASMGSRHLVPLFPFLTIPAAFAFRRAPRLSAVLAGVSVLVCLLCVATFPEFPDAWTRSREDPTKARRLFPFPLRDFVWPLVAEGRVGEKGLMEDGRVGYAARMPAGHEWDAYNLGEVLGLRGPWSLTPLLALWAAAGWALFGRRRRKPA